MPRIYINKLEPEKYPEFTRRTAPAVTKGALENRIQFTSLRGFPSKQDANNGSRGQDAAITQNNNMTEIDFMEETVDMYARHFNLGKVLWPVYPTLFAKNFDELVELCGREGLFMFDFWGYVPGSKASGDSIWGEYAIPPDADRLMREELGGRFLGYDNGEQDGRYISYARAAAPLAGCRRAQYKSFQKYFEKLFDAMLNHTVTLASLTFLHYFAKEGNSIMLGAETAQGLPSGPMWFSFIRGAGKQYGLLWFGNASVWNRWGYKEYSVDSKTPDTSGGYEMGRFAGTSLGLLKRLMYNHYMYNCDILGFENSWFKTEETEEPGAGTQKDEKSYTIGGKRNVLTPIGEIQRDCVRFTERFPDPGAMYTPLAIVADFFAGWAPPRHLYTSDIYKVWGNLPYESGDYQLHALFSMLYPGYENAGYYRDERGFDPNTPFGEIADVLLSDVRGAVLNRYAVAVILGSVELTLELYLKLKDYVRGGGRLIIFAETVYKYTGLSEYDPGYPDFFGVGDLCADNAGTNISKHNYQNGTVAVISNEGGLVSGGEGFGRENAVNAPIAHPYSFSPETEGFFADEFESLRIIGVSNKNLRYCVNVFKTGEDGKREYTLYVANSNFREERFDITCREGSVITAEKLDIPDAVNELEEYLPLLRESGCGGGEKSGKYIIKPGDCQIWRVGTAGNLSEIYPESLPAAPEKQFFLKIGPRLPIKDFILDHPTFAHHFKGVMIEAEYLDRLDKAAAQREAHYIKLQKIRLIVDFTGLINHYPDLSLIGNIQERAAKSIEKIASILEKARLYGAEGAIFTSHRNAENEYTHEQGIEGLKKSFEEIGRICGEYGITMYLQNRHEAIHGPAIKEIADNYAVNTAYAQLENRDCIKDIPNCSLLLLSACISDGFGQRYAANKPVRGSGAESYLTSCFDIASKKNIPIVMSASYSCWDEVVGDLVCLSQPPDAV